MASNERGTMSYGMTRSANALLSTPNMKAEVERTLRTIFKRCVQCPDTTPSCPPSCQKGEICSLVPADCNTCPYMICIANPNPPPKNPGPNIGAIAGGVVGGVAAIAIVVFFVWRFWIKKRREQQEMEAEEWEDDEIAQQKAQHFSAMHTSDALSTRTRGSLANSILSRASNIIQIAYIPGVTNRNGSGHNSLLGNAPVPPIPAATRGSQPPKSPLSNEGDMLFFRPGDLRDSSYSGASSIRSGIRDTQYTRQSITPSLARSSMVSESYRDEVTPPLPATTVARAAPRMVSIKSSLSQGSDTCSTTEEPANTSEVMDFAAGGKGKGIQIMMPREGSPSASSSLRGQAKQVTVGGAAKGRFPVRQPSDASTVASTTSKHRPAISSPLAEIEDTDEEDDDDHARARRSMHLISTSLNQAIATPPLIQPLESPFFDASEHPPAAANKGLNPYASMAANVDATRAGKMNGGHLSDIIEEGMKRASRIPSHEGLGGKRDISPFSDAHATQ
ncbi:overproduction-induced pheromone-resistant [Elasticomyces elasticus]|nr:overproduction-induced pheromone-resistant [Elasticomyces elasticus]